jgi:hypothetical protein
LKHAPSHRRCQNRIFNAKQVPDMKLTAYRKSEPSVVAWLWRLLLGPASIFDGLVETFTLGSFSAGAKLDVARNLARARILAR